MPVDDKDINSNPSVKTLDACNSAEIEYNVIQLDFVKSALNTNPCMVIIKLNLAFIIAISWILEPSESSVFARRWSIVC